VNRAVVSADAETTLFGVPLTSAAPVPSIRARRAAPAVALEQSIADLLDDGPCYVAFSGGADSSLVLSAAVVVCRRHGHADPIPVTYRYANAARTDEREYQEAVVRELGLRDWTVLELADTDLVGPQATELLVEHGPLFPASAFATAAALRGLSPGLFLTGEGGDDVLGPRRWTAANHAARSLIRDRKLPPLRFARGALRGLVPAALRAGSTFADIDTAYAPDWLKAKSRRRLVEKAVVLEAREPLTPVRWLRYHLSLPWVSIGTHNLRALHDAVGFRWEAPLLSPSLLGALAGSTSWWEYRGRSALLHRHFGELLPAAVVERSTKALFGDVLFGPHTKAFARAWSGEGAPAGVDAERLRSIWLGEDPHIGTALLLQHCWLACASSWTTQSSIGVRAS
jgi:asparagine synthase (glutamine-hydrolysing)